MVTEPCARCGGKQVRPASLWERLRSWFVDGGGLAQLQVCAGCGAPRGRGSWTTRYRRVDRSWWRVPAQLLRAVRRERTWEPVPVFYTLVGAAVAVPTAVGAGLVRPRRAWRWPLGAAGVAVGATFVLSLASSVRGGQAARAIRRTLAPERALAEDLERQAATIRDHAAEQPVFVPDTWDAPVAFGGHGISDPDGEPRLTSLSVVAGSGATIGEWPWLRIEVRYEPWLPVEVVEEELVTEVASSEPSQQVDVEGLDLRESTDRERLEAVWAARERRQQARERELS